jgi:thymidylate synthase (FAD)
MIEKGYTINVLDHGYVRLIDWMGDDQRICEAARISYKSPSKGKEQDEKLIRYLWNNQHLSPFEQVKISFNIKLPVFVMRQFVRHRMQNLNEVSARYTELPDEFYIPTQWRKQDTKNKQGSVVEQDFNKKGAILPYSNGQIDKKGNLGVQITGTLNETFTGSLQNCCNNCYSTYKMFISSGVAREMARMVLPVNIYTEIYSCWDLRNLLHFISLRDESHAQFEIREYAKAMKSICLELFPVTMRVFEEKA